MSSPFTGGRTLMLGSAATGILCLALTVLGFARDATLAATSWLLAFTYWTGLTMASLLIVVIFNTAAAKWITLLRRQLEHHASALAVCAAAFAGVVLSAKHLYLWADEEAVQRLPEHARHLIHHKHAWLNVPGFTLRGAICLAIFLGVWFLLDRASRRQETRPPDDKLRSTTRGLSAGSLFFLALAMTSGAVDWLMSLEPEWFSAIFGVYWFAGSFVSAIALLMLAVMVPSDPNLAAARTSNQHVANLAALLFAFSCFWAYAGFSQYLIIWQANLPEEVSWLSARGLFDLARFHRGIDPPLSAAEWNPTGTAWFPVTALLIIGRFALPFLLLLSYHVKRDRKLLTALAVWTLTMQFVDTFWMIKPALRLRSAGLALPEATVTWTDVTAWVGLGALCFAFVLFRMRGRHAVPLNDPTLEYSVHYRQPLA